MRGASDESVFAKCMEAVARQLLGSPVKTCGDELRFRSNFSLVIDTRKGIYKDHTTEIGGGTLDLVMFVLNVSKSEARQWLVQHGHIPADYSAESHKPEQKMVAEYDYVDEKGKRLFQVCRMEPKGFTQRRQDSNGNWIRNRKGVREVIYFLPEVIIAVAANEIVYIVEGEKSVERLVEIGATATCSPGGANKFKEIYAPAFAGANVVILPDEDKPGQSHAVCVARVLDGVARRIRTVSLPGLPEGGDVADWLDAGGTLDALQELVDATPDTLTIPLLNIEKDELEDGQGCVTEDSVALAFTKEHCNDLRFDHNITSWYRWSGAAWTKESTKLAFSWARVTARKLAKQIPKDSVLMMAGKASFAAGVERFVQSSREFAVTSAIWDADPWLLGTPGGTIDLRTGRMRSAQQMDYITKLTSVTPSDTIDCPQWLTFLDQATDGNQELVDFLQRWFGYTLTGITREHALVFIFGDGGNGKGVCMNTIAAILNDYCVTAAMDTFVATKNDKHPTDMAMLSGARMVVVNEVEEGAVWAESRLKAMTGGDPVTARFMRKDFYTYLPFFKLTISGNHKPTLKNLDEATRRRANMVPFLHQPKVVDMLLSDKLKSEWPGILRWMVDGCLKWQEVGLKQPAVVSVATEKYFQEQNIIEKWVEDRCEINHGMEVRAGLLMTDFRVWVAINGEYMPTPPVFRKAIERIKGVRYVTTRGASWVKGIGLNVLK